MDHVCMYNIKPGIKFYIIMLCSLSPWYLGGNFFIEADYWLVISVYLSSLPVAHLSDVPRRRIVVTGDIARIQDETPQSSAWFCNMLGIKRGQVGPRFRVSSERQLTLSQTSPCFYVSVFSTGLLKTLWEKEKLLVTNNFSFSHNVFYPFGELSAIFIQLAIVVCKLFQFGRV